MSYKADRVNGSKERVALRAVGPGAQTGSPSGVMKKPTAGHENNWYQQGYRYSNLRPYTTGMLCKSLQGCIHGVSQVDIPVSPLSQSREGIPRHSSWRSTSNLENDRGEQGMEQLPPTVVLETDKFTVA